MIHGSCTCFSAVTQTVGEEFASAVADDAALGANKPGHHVTGAVTHKQPVLKILFPQRWRFWMWRRLLSLGNVLPHIFFIVFERI